MSVKEIIEEENGSVEEEEVGNADAISNPLYKEGVSPMVIVSVGSERFIGSLDDLDEGLCTIILPLRYGEFGRPSPNGEIQIDMAMNKVYSFVGIMQHLRLAYDTIYVLNPNNEDDVTLVELYAQNHERLKRQDAGQIEIKEKSRIIMPGMNDVAIANQTKVR